MLNLMWLRSPKATVGMIVIGIVFLTGAFYLSTNSKTFSLPEIFVAQTEPTLLYRAHKPNTDFYLNYTDSERTWAQQQGFTEWEVQLGYISYTPVTGYTPLYRAQVPNTLKYVIYTPEKGQNNLKAFGYDEANAKIIGYVDLQSGTGKEALLRAHKAPDFFMGYTPSKGGDNGSVASLGFTLYQVTLGYVHTAGSTIKIEAASVPSPTTISTTLPTAPNLDMTQVLKRAHNPGVNAYTGLNDKPLANYSSVVKTLGYMAETSQQQYLTQNSLPTDTLIALYRAVKPGTEKYILYTDAAGGSNGSVQNLGFDVTNKVILGYIFKKQYKGTVPVYRSLHKDQPDNFIIYTPAQASNPTIANDYTEWRTILGYIYEAPRCIPNQKQCMGYWVQTCNATGTGWTNTQQCANGCKQNQCLETTTGTSSEKPNIIVIVADDMPANYLTVNGIPQNPWIDNTVEQSQYPGKVRTPTLQKMANEGVMFNNMQHIFSACQPSRASLLTGKVPHANGMLSMGYQIDLNQSLLPKLLKNNGYATSIIGKCHLAGLPYYENNDEVNGRPINADPFVKQLGFDYRLLPYPDKGVINNWNDYGVTINGVAQQIRRQTFLADYSEAQADDKAYVTNYFTDKAIEFLNTPEAQSKPFFLWLAHVAPHYPYTQENLPPKIRRNGYTYSTSTTFPNYSKGENLLIKPFQNTYYPYFMGDSTIEPNYKFGTEYGEFNTVQNGKNNFGNNYLQGIEQFKIIEHEMITNLDENVNRLIKALESNGQMDNTIIVFLSDNGYHFGEHGLLGKGAYAYEQSNRTPVFFYAKKWAASWKKGVNEALLSSIDFMPTILEFAKTAIPTEVQGLSFKKILETGVSSHRSSSFYEFEHAVNGYHDLPFRGVLLSNGIKFTHYDPAHYDANTYGEWSFHFDGYDFELYDLKQDPFEKNNLLARQGDPWTPFKSNWSPSMSSDRPLARGLQNATLKPKILQALRELATWQTKTNDTRKVVISSPNVLAPGTGTLTISWNTNVDAMSEVMYKAVGCSTCTWKVKEVAGYRKTHQVELTGLTEAQKYQVRAYSYTDQGNGGMFEREVMALSYAPCSPTTKQCSGDILQTCSIAGQWVNTTTCSTQSSYCDSGTKTCVAYQCTATEAGKSFCSNTTTKATCSADRKTKTPTICPTGQQCSNGACVVVTSSPAPTCTANAKRCSGSILQTCTNNTWQNSQTCTAEQYCDGSSLSCVAYRCTAAQANTKWCDGVIAKSCSTDRKTLTTTTCTTGQICQAGSCVTDATYCASNNTYRCTTTGREQCINNHWAAATACVAGQECSNGNCVAITNYCSPVGTARCVTGGKQTCGTNNLWSATTTCPTGQECTGQGTCTAISGYCSNDTGCTATQACNLTTHQCQAVPCSTTEVCKIATASNHQCQTTNKTDGTSCGTNKICQTGSCIDKPAEPLACEGDMNADAQVNSADLLDLFGAWGTSCTGCKQDLDKSGVVGAGDLGMLFANWGSCGSATNPWILKIAVLMNRIPYER